MKRALAERAKQSGHPTGLAPPSGDSPPQKVPRIQKPIEDGTSSSQQPQQQSVPQRVPSSSSTTATPSIAIPTSSSTTTAPPKSPQSGSSTPRQRNNHKRQRQQQHVEESGDEASSDAFYLKHQNRALASELKALQHQLRSLEKERDARRRQCRNARQALQELEETWTKMETALQLGMPPTKQEQPNQPPPVAVGSDSTGAVKQQEPVLPMSTGSGESVELIGALLDSLAALGHTKAPLEDDDMADTASGVSQRAAALQRWIWQLLQNSNESSSRDVSNLLNAASLKGEIEALRLQCKDYESRIAELAQARDEASNSDRRVRRGLYRLAAGRMQLKQVMKAVEDDDKDGMAAQMAVQEMKKPASPIVKTEEIDEEGKQQPVDSAQLAQLKRQLQDLEEVASSREKQIEQFLKEREEQIKRINSLVLPKSEQQQQGSGVTDDNVKQSALYIQTSSKLTSIERQLEEKGELMKHVREQWAKQKGDTELVMKTLQELQSKHKKRWSELTNSHEGSGETISNENKQKDSDAMNESASNDGGAGDQRLLQQAQRTVELEHKLKQALENVRQAETVRVSLAEAIKMNEGLQAKLEELRTKNAALVAGKSALRANSIESSSLSTPKEKPSSHGSAEKLQREHRRMRKELAAALTSKEGAKAKQERAEKERDALVKTNSRLLKQSVEKDDMNAKSLSTILHLKSLTDQLEQEKELLEQKAKSSNQLALAARLATNAKERVGEEAMKEKKALEEQLAKSQESLESLKQAKEAAEGRLSQSRAEMSAMEKDVATSQKRCEELAEETTKREEEKRRLLESLAVAQREAMESSKKFASLASARGGNGVGSEFTTEELTTQVSVLKGRLACPVCNHRDKKCILLRCRHMFCKQCVEENVRNRSRKCPACGQRFDNKDVADVWL